MNYICDNALSTIYLYIIKKASRNIIIIFKGRHFLIIQHFCFFPESLLIMHLKCVSYNFNFSTYPQRRSAAALLGELLLAALHLFDLQLLPRHVGRILYPAGSVLLHTSLGGILLHATTVLLYIARCF